MTDSVEPVHEANRNLVDLRANTYPGRIIGVGLSQGGGFLVHVAAMMGRSAASRNRVYLNDRGRVYTHPADPSKPSGDPEMTLYAAMQSYGNTFVVGNGKQTDTALEYAPAGNSFRSALHQWEYEPDGTQRITGLSQLGSETHQLGSVRKALNGASIRTVWDFSPIPGLLFCLQTYRGDGNPLPPYTDSPYLLPVGHNCKATADQLWGALNPEHRVGLVVKWVNPTTGHADVCIHNKYEQVSALA